MELKKKSIGKTLLAVFAYFFISFLAGSIRVIGNFADSTAIIFQAICIGSLVGITFLFLRFRGCKLNDLGIKKVKKEQLRKVFYLVPLVVISLSDLIGGISVKEMKLGLASVILALIVGMAEEFYFRGIILHIWLKKNSIEAILISSAIFGLFHLLNGLGNASIYYIVVQVIFAFAYGITLAIVTILTESILPGIIVHFFHDVCAFLGNDIAFEGEIAMAILWILILVIYSYFISKRNLKES